MTDKDTITLHKSDCALLLGGYQCTCGLYQRNSKTLPALAAEQPKPTDKDSLTVQSRLDAESFREERDEARALLNGVLQDIEALRRDAERLKDAMRKAMAMLDKHEPEPAGAFAVLLLALNPELQSAKNALRREE